MTTLVLNFLYIAIVDIKSSLSEGVNLSVS